MAGRVRRRINRAYLTAAVALALALGVMALLGEERRESSLARETSLQMAQLAVSLKIYKLVYGGYPASLDDLVEAPAVAQGPAGQAMVRASLTDCWGRPLRYLRNPSATLISSGADVIESADDIIVHLDPALGQNPPALSKEAVQ